MELNSKPVGGAKKQPRLAAVTPASSGPTQRAAAELPGAELEAKKAVVTHKALVDAGLVLDVTLVRIRQVVDVLGRTVLYSYVRVYAKAGGTLCTLQRSHRRQVCGRPDGPVMCEVSYLCEHGSAKALESTIVTEHCVRCLG